jgi:hypothetical protein
LVVHRLGLRILDAFWDTDRLPQDLLIYWAIIGVGAALHFYSRYRERESHAAQLEARLAQAQLESLRMQLNARSGRAVRRSPNGAGRADAADDQVSRTHLFLERGRD